MQAMDQEAGNCLKPESCFFKSCFGQFLYRLNKYQLFSHVLQLESCRLARLKSPFSLVHDRSLPQY